MNENPCPADEDVQILRAVVDRILVEFEVEKHGCELAKDDPVRENVEEPMRGLVHGPPGTGKSRLIYWIRRWFVEALGWEHGVQFLCVAFQNRVAYAMGAVTLHSGGDVSMGGGHKSLEPTLAVDSPR